MIDFSWGTFFAAAAGAFIGAMISRNIRERLKRKPFQLGGPNVEKLRREMEEADLVAELQFLDEEHERTPKDEVITQATLAARAEKVLERLRSLRATGCQSTGGRQ